jgi:hypothetical protein
MKAEDDKMTEADFWNLIETAKADADGDTERQAEILTERITELPEAEIIAFERIFRTLHQQSYDWKLWGAAYLLNGGCSDDGFDYFRGWLIAQGQSIFENALKDPDSLADVVTAEQVEEAIFESETMLSIAQSAYEKKTGIEYFEGVEIDGIPPFPGEPSGERWEDEDLEELLPRLFALTDTEEEDE